MILNKTIRLNNFLFTLLSASMIEATQVENSQDYFPKITLASKEIYELISFSWEPYFSKFSAFRNLVGRMVPQDPPTMPPANGEKIDHTIFELFTQFKTKGMTLIERIDFFDRDVQNEFLEEDFIFNSGKERFVLNQNADHPDDLRLLSIWDSKKNLIYTKEESIEKKQKKICYFDPQADAPFWKKRGKWYLLAPYIFGYRKERYTTRKELEERLKFLFQKRIIDYPSQSYKIFPNGGENFTIKKADGWLFPRTVEVVTVPSIYHVHQFLLNREKERYASYLYNGEDPSKFIGLGLITLVLGSHIVEGIHKLNAIKGDSRSEFFGNKDLYSKPTVSMISMETGVNLLSGGMNLLDSSLFVSLAALSPKLLPLYFLLKPSEALGVKAEYFQRGNLSPADQCLGSYCTSFQGIECAQSLESITSFLKPPLKTPCQDNAVLLLGPTGSGKSTLLNYIAGRKLITKKAGLNIEVSVIDPVGEISHEMSSATFRPNFWNDADGKLCYYDAPGFGDTRGMAYDVAKAFFLQQLGNSLKSLRIVLVIEESAMVNNKAIGFITTMKDFEDFIGKDNFMKIHNSSSFIITKSDGSLNNIHYHIQRHFIDAKHADLSEDVRIFLKSILKNRRIGVFEKPNEQLNSKNKNGNNTSIFSYFYNYVFDIFNYIYYGGNNLSKMISTTPFDISKMINGTELFLSDQSLFKLVVSPETELKIINCFHHFNDNITKSVEEIDYIMQSHYADSIKKVVIDKDMVQKWYNSHKEWFQRLSSPPIIKKPEDLIEKINHKISELGIRVTSDKNLEHVLNKIKQLEIYMDFIIDFSNNANNKHKLEYEPRDWIPRLENTVRSLEKFNNNYYDYNIIKNGNTIIVEGYSPKISDIINKISNRYNDSQFNNIQIYSFNGVYFDISTTNEFSGIDLSIFTPKWKVKDDIKLSLSGKDGKPFDPLQAKNGEDGKDGEDGLPGKPGSNSGHFFGIMEQFFGNENFSDFIEVNGGKGGKGQDGGKGGKGSNGADANADSLSLENNNGYYSSGTWTDWMSDIWNSEYEEKNYILYGQKGHEGGLGGRKGAGGKGGLPGTIEIIKLNNQSNFAINGIRLDGESGNAGLHGDAGDGGRSIQKIYHETRYLGWKLPLVLGTVSIVGCTASLAYYPAAAICTIGVVATGGTVRTIWSNNTGYWLPFPNYDLCLMADLPRDGEPSERKMYLEESNNKLKYTVIAPDGNVINDTLDVKVDGQLTSENLKILRSEILEQAFKKNHTFYVTKERKSKGDSRGYDFHLMTELPENGPLEGKMYFEKIANNTLRYKVRDSFNKVAEKNFRILINKNLTSEFLNDMRSQILEKTSKMGYKRSETREGENREGLKEPPTLEPIDFPKVINGYKKYVRENLVALSKDEYKDNLLIKSQKDYLEDFLGKLDAHRKVKKKSSVLGFIQEFKDLEDQYSTLRSQVNLLPYYKSLQERIVEYDNDVSQEDHDLKKVLNYLYASVLSRICNLNAFSEPSLIIDILEYLESINKGIESIKEIDKKAQINFYKKEYENHLSLKIEEANHFIKILESEIEETASSLNKHIKNLLEEIEDLKKQNKEDQKELTRKREGLQRLMPIKSFLGILSIGSQMLRILGPVGSLSGEILSTSFSAGQSFLSSDTSEVLSNLPEAVNNNVGLYQSYISEQEKENEKEQRLEFIQSWIERESHNKIEDKKKQNERDAIIKDIKDFDKIGLNLIEYDISFSEEVKKINEEALKRKDKIITKKEYFEKRQAFIEKIQTSVNILKSGVDLYNICQSDKSKLDELGEAIQKKAQELNRLQEYQRKIESEFRQSMKAVKETLNDNLERLKFKPHAALDFQKWEITKHLIEAKHAIKEMLNGFKVEEKFKRSLEKIEGAFGTVITIYDRIQNFEDQAKLVRYIADISSSHFSGIQVNDPVLRENIRMLEGSIFSNIVTEQYAKVINAVKQWSFPFAGILLGKLKDLPIFSWDNFMSTTNTQVMVIDPKKISNNLQKLGGELKRYSSGVHPIDKFIITARFSPFVVWNYTNYPSEILKILQGTEVVLKAAVDKKYPALKFSCIYLEVFHEDNSQQSKLENMLKDYEYTLTYWGNSFYSFNKKIYQSSSRKLPIFYSFEKDNTGNPVKSNGVAEKLCKGKPMLSPYAYWSVRIEKAKALTSTDDLYRRFNVISDNFISGIGIRLVGKGTYVDEELISAKIKGRLELNQYYSEGWH